LKVRKIDYTVGAGISQNKPYHPGERRKYGQKQEGRGYREIAAGTQPPSEEELAELKEEGGVIKTEGTAFGRKLAKKLPKS
jgi:hypothetical protein